MSRYGDTADESKSSLCASCTHSMHIKGASFSEDVKLCNRTSFNPIRITFKVIQCNEYQEASRVSLSDMYDIAWNFSIDTNRKFVGFKPPKRDND